MVSPWIGWILCLVGFHLSFSVALQRPLRARTISSQRYSSMQDTTIPTDLILSSGFCAFARQAGVLAALEDFNISIDRCVGTSSGSLAASLYCTGQFTPTQIADELSSRRPISLCQPTLRLNRGLLGLGLGLANNFVISMSSTSSDTLLSFFKSQSCTYSGAFSLRGLIAHLRTLLPKDFDQLPRKLAVGQPINTPYPVLPYQYNLPINAPCCQSNESTTYLPKHQASFLSRT